MSRIPKKIIQELCQRDEIFQTIYDRYGIAPDWSRPSGFSTLIHIILEQQVSLESAQAAYNKLATKLGQITPTKLLQLSDDELRACYFSRQKTSYARALSQAILQGDLDLTELEKLPAATIREQLIAIKGIGNWTIDIYLIFCLKSPDIFPPGDIAAINSTKELTGLKSKDAVVKRSEMWQPYRSYATKMLWHSYLCKRGRTVAYD